METTTNTLTTAIAELTKQVELLTAENEKLRISGNSSEGTDGVIQGILKAIPREKILDVLGVKEFHLADVDRDLIIEFVEENFEIGEIYEMREICEWVKDNCEIEHCFDNDDLVEYVKFNCEIGDCFDGYSLVEWVKDNNEITDLYDASDVTAFDLGDVLNEFGEEQVMEEVSNQGWSKQKDVTDIISTLEDVIESLRG